MKRFQGILLFAAVVLITIFSISKAVPPDVVPATAPDSVFSAARAFPHLKQIARAPHSMGTPEHARVRAYIVNHCQSLGLETTVQHTTATGSFRSSSTVFAGNVYNIIARLKGTGSGKSVAVMAHYDSHPNTVGAGDDGAAVAAMLETARILKNGRPLKNDVLFVFTDGEESGLIGAKAFMEESGLVPEIGIVLNFEARGSGGISNMFEVNNENGWVMKHFRQAAAHPFANSLSFEVYKLLPNDTDFTLFKKAGITGLNHAFIEHLEDYHSMTDTPENLDQRSLQHHGANMLSLARHFANTEITNTKSPDRTYFNLLGSMLVMYKADLNFLFVVFAGMLTFIYLVMLYRTSRINARDFLKSLGLFMVTLVAMAVVTWIIQKGIAAAYPYNNRFYENNGYGSRWYFLAVTAAGLGVFSLFYQWGFRRIHFNSLFAAVICIHTILMVAMSVLMPTATYLFCFPLILALLTQLFFHRKYHVQNTSWQFGVVNLLFSIPALLLFAPTISAIFTAFGLGPLMPGGVVITGLLLGLLIPVLSSALLSNTYFLRGISITVFLVALLFAHLQGRFNQQRPMQSNIWYLLDADQNKAQWISDHVKTDDFNKRFFKNAVIEKVVSRQGTRLTSNAELFPVQAPQAMLQDTAARTDSAISIHCSSPRKALSMSVSITVAEPLRFLKVDGKPVETKFAEQEGKYVYNLQYYAVPENGFDLVLGTSKVASLALTLTDRSLGIPQIQGGSFPSHVIPGEGRTSNTLQVRKSFVF